MASQKELLESKGTISRLHDTNMRVLQENERLKLEEIELEKQKLV